MLSLERKSGGGMVNAGADWLNRSPRGKLLITGSNPVLTTKLNYMATLETQYKNYLLENPDSKFTFDEWKEWLGNQLNEALEDLKKNQKNIR